MDTLEICREAKLQVDARLEHESPSKAIYLILTNASYALGLAVVSLEGEKKPATPA